MAKTPITPVIRIDEEKCVNCYACIAECPVKYCMDASKAIKAELENYFHYDIFLLVCFDETN
jgi:ferredoxin